MPDQDRLDNEDADNAYDGPPDYRVVGRHAVFPETGHDEIERINFLAQMNRHLAARVMPGVQKAYAARVEPKFRAEHGRAPADRHEVRKAILGDPPSPPGPRCGASRWNSASRRGAGR